MSIKDTLNTRITVAMQAAGIPDDCSPMLALSGKPQFGDFQANGAMGAAKRMKTNPRELAQLIIDNLDLDGIAEKLEIAGPGFINITLANKFLAASLSEDPVTRTTKPQNIVVDYSSPNLAKEMHVGHLRSTIIGDSLARVLEFRGHRVLRLNHVGDWGTQFGMLITHLKQVAPETLNTADAVDLGDLVAFYREAKKRFDEDEAFQTTSREEVVKLQGGDPVSLKAWGLLCDQSRREFQKIYDRLDIRLSERGESFYNPYLASVLSGLKEAGLLVTDDGAECVFLEGVNGKDGKPLPVIVRKSDGGFNYATTDLAAIRYRFAQASD